MITPKELDGIDSIDIIVDDKQALIDFIDHRLKSNPKDFSYEIQAVGILFNKEGWEDVAKNVLSEYEKVGWIITGVVIFFSFRTRVEFYISKR